MVLPGGSFAESCGGDPEKPFKPVGKIITVAHVAGPGDLINPEVGVQQHFLSLPKEEFLPVFAGRTAHLALEDLKQQRDTDPAFCGDFPDPVIFIAGQQLDRMADPVMGPFDAGMSDADEPLEHGFHQQQGQRFPARFFMYFLDLPKKFEFLGITFTTFNTIMIVVLIVAISIICMGGSMAIIVTDTIQGFICYPLMVLFVVFLLYRFSLTQKIMPVLSARVAGENFLNPYDIDNLRDFNYFFLIVGVVSTLLHRASWTGAGGSSSAARSPHEQKMASLLGTWRGAVIGVFYVLLAVALLAFLTHNSFAPQAHHVRQELSHQIAKDIVKDAAVRDKVVAGINASKAEVYHPGKDKAQSDKDSIDTRYLAGIHKNLTDNEKDVTAKGKGNSLFQQFRTLYYQQLLPATLRNMLPAGMLGLFCLLMILAMISTDDSRIFSATVTISQDVILPFIKRQLTPKQHMWMLRSVAICIGIFFYLGSSYMAQLDYINLYVTLVCTMWLGGCGPVIVFGLYSRFGNTLGAWASLLNGVFMSLIGVLVQRNWADHVYPWLARNELVEGTAKVLETLSKPFNPIIVW